VQVYHGLVGLKTHCKLALIVRRDPDGKMRRYAHLGTGNYNPSTARFYTDLSLLTQDESVTESVHHVFNYLTAYSERSQYHPLFVAPLNLGRNCISLIEREMRHAKSRHPAFIIAKVNSLLDKDIILALYRASQAGVHVELIVRGGCALRPGVRGISGRVRVRSIIGRFLEHSRIFVFGNGQESEVYLGSADWMPRNLHERVEVMFHLKDQRLCQKVCTRILAPYLADTEKARFLLANGSYVRAQAYTGLSRATSNGTRFNVQNFFMEMSEVPEEESNDDELSVATHLAGRTYAPIAEFLAANCNPEREKAD
jgi:polyphosphate kinase